MNKYSIVPSLYRNKVSEDTNSQISIELDATRKELIEFDKDLNIDLRNLYEKEKNNSFNIRPIFNINYIYNNYYSGTTSSKYQNELIYPVISDLLIQNQNTKKGLLQPYEFDFFRPPTSKAFGYESVSAYTYNWNYCLSYPYKNDYSKSLGIKIKDRDIEWVVSKGIPFITERIIINGFDIIRITCGLLHNLNEGESILVNIDNIEKLYNIFSFGDGSFNSEKYIVNILNINNEIKSNITGTLKRVILDSNSGETISEYYIRNHKVINGGENLIVTKAGFQKGVFDGKTVLSYHLDGFLSFKKESNYAYNFSLQNEINIDGVVDNQNRPLTELYLTIVFRGYSGFFASRNEYMKQGWEFNITSSKYNDWWHSRNPKSNSKIESVSYFDDKNNEFFYYKKPSDFDGDLCEYNMYDQKEIVISDFYYKIKHSTIFNIGNNENGYYYKPHNKLQLKVFSDYVETLNSNVASNIPNYAFYSKIDGQFRWRDIYNVGFFDDNNNGVNYPFINNSFYPFVNSVFKLIPEGYDYYDEKILKSTSIDDKFLIVKPVKDECE